MDGRAMTTADWCDLGEAEALQEGSSRAFQAQGMRICVIRDAGCFYALSDICTHGYAFLSEGECDTSDGVVECPLHGGLFDYRTGAPKGSPAERDAPTFKTKVEGGRLFVQIGET
jgi:nitrite reductase/ring-hydroxylating ferredoxin subunit